MDVYDRNMKQEVANYMNNQNNNQTSFLDQFKIQTIGSSNEIFDNNTQPLDNKYSSPNAPTTYNVVSPDEFTMHPANEFSKLKVTPGNRRDNSLVINNYYALETGSYVENKKEMKAFSDTFKNPTALGGLSYDGQGQDVYENFNNKNGTSSQKLQRDRFQVSKYNSHASDEKMWQRAEATDGVPINDGTRAKQKTLEERRGKSIHTQRLAPEGRNNKTGKTGEGKSVAPENVTLTKYPKKKNIKQEEKDWLRTTGAFIKPEMRSKVQEPKTNRTISKPVIGPAKAVTSFGENRNNQPLNPTNRTMENNHITNMRSVIDKPGYRTDQPTNPTNRTMENNHITNIRSVIDKPGYRTDQPTNPTNRTMENNHITNMRSTIDKTRYRNEQPANPTNRTVENTHITNMRSLNDKTRYRNEQPANPTIRSETGDTNYTGGGLVETRGVVYENLQPANPTIRSDTGETNYTGVGLNEARGVIYENLQPANPTIRSETGETNYSGGGLIETRGVVYENQQPANPTFRQETGPNDYLGPNKSLKTYKTQSDNTRSGVVEDVAPKDYTGIHASSVPTTESRLMNDNFINSDRIEGSLDLTEREARGGTGQIGAGKDKAGEFSNNGKKGMENNYKTGGNIIASGYKECMPDCHTRGKSLLQQREQIDRNVPIVLNGNPYINNNVHKSISNHDNIRSRTLLSDRTTQS
jgi:hypothetical protein